MRQKPKIELLPLPGYAHTPIVALTANALRGMRELYLEKGFDDYLSKLISPEALDAIINKWIRERGMENGKQGYRSEAMLESNTQRLQTTTLIPNPLSLEIEARRLDKLNHYRAAFEMSKSASGPTSSGLEIDAEYDRRFAALVESFDALPACE